MILERYREHTVNMGPGTYESMKIGASVKLDSENLPDGIHAAGMEELYSVAERMLDEALESDLKEAAEISLLNNSHIRSWKTQ